MGTGEQTTVHGSRIKFFRNSDLEIDTSVKDYLAFQAVEYCIIEDIADLRERHGKVQVLVRCKGLDDEEPTWTPIEELEQDVSAMLTEFLYRMRIEGSKRKKDLANSVKFSAKREMVLSSRS